MDPRASRPLLQVLGENEALQQFFSGQDVGGVLDSSVAVDTSVLEQYLCNDMDPSSFMLPESPPDSSSEACSPPQIPDLRHERTCWTTWTEALHPETRSVSGHFRDRSSISLNLGHVTQSSSCCFKDQGSAPSLSDLMTQEPIDTLGLPYVQSGSTPVLHRPLHQDSRGSPEPHLNPENCLQGYTPPTPPPSLPPSSTYVSPVTGPTTLPHRPSPALNRLLGCAHTSTSTPLTCSQEGKKRRRSESDDLFEAPGGEAERTFNGSVGNAVNGPGLGSSQTLAWEQYRPEQWSSLYNHHYQTLPPPVCCVHTDKGFNYSPSDEAFVCQKKNHFQVTVHIGVAADPLFVKTQDGPQEVDYLHIKVFGVKFETPSHEVTIEQSQPDRSKKPFHPVRVALSGGRINKVTLGRLHFSETTSNNMRKKGKPNPDQRYFQMVVGLYAAVGQETFLLSALVSERIIVRASNPGQFDTDSDTLWQRGAVQETVVCQGRVGINTDSPDEALVVCGNAKVMGAIIQPSDCRAKQNIQEVDSEEQLKRITQMRIVEFDYKPEFASSTGIDHTHQTGVIAQEVKELLPSAVKEVGDITCSDGEKIPNFLMVDKEQIFMENVGAVQQLSKLTDNLETRIQELEVWNRRLAKLKSLTGSLRSAGKPQRRSSVSTTSTSESRKSVKLQKEGGNQRCGDCQQNKLLQAGSVILLLAVAFCVISVSALYIIHFKAGDVDVPPGGSDAGPVTTQTTVGTSTVPATRPPDSWPPDVEFCHLLYCDEVYCCPSPAGGGTHYNITAPKTVSTDRRTEKVTRHLKSARDWKNTTIHTFMIKENQQVIDSKYCVRDGCGPGRFIFRVPISQFVPLNMKVTLLMNSTELLVVHLCRSDESRTCSSLLDANMVTGGRYPSNTQGDHEWPLHVARLYDGSYHFRSAVAGQADCSTDHHYAGALFTDYHFSFYRRCT
ncbi:myelin regulatory factor-like protein isoform X1 [Nothobranchius furzeri]|uniref:Myelin regulatory factor-like n=1 Tax=Nothobranchius furzeri TaxID=105023 RepID=A0A9D3C2W3_NOTFU|nr:myelin regulatory factor-like [Nothobranchius furzeri]